MGGPVGLAPGAEGLDGLVEAAGVAEEVRGGEAVVVEERDGVADGAGRGGRGGGGGGVGGGRGPGVGGQGKRGGW